jgi:two-component system, cell cycle sensor histidine kinase and response regulator CckA
MQWSGQFLFFVAGIVVAWMGTVWYFLRERNRLRSQFLDDLDSLRPPPSLGASSPAAEESDPSTESLQVAKNFHSQKMEAIGTLAGGVAHDFNNILGAVVGKTNVAISRLPNGHYAREPLDDILSACRRAKSLVRQLMDFGRPDPGKLTPVDPSGVVREVVRMMRSSASARIRFLVDQPAKPLLVDADPSRLQQVVLNLVTNSVQAIGPRTGTVRLVVSSAPPTAADARPEVVLTVEDDGCGMSPEVQRRIFEPFFTTKGSTEGSGWGLAVTHAAVGEMGGGISVRSAPGKGSVFTVRFPASESGLGATDSGGFERPASLHSQAVRLLMVDDEPLILSAYAELLEAVGCQVVRSGGALKAIEILENREEAIDILVTDLAMPQMSGLHLARRAKELRPSLPIVLLSGNLARESREEAENIGIGACLSKPIEITDLVQVIEALLGRQPCGEEAQAQLAFPDL